MSNKISKNLKKAFKAKNTTLVLGSGISQPFGIPSWPALLSRIVDSMHPDTSLLEIFGTNNVEPLFLARYIRQSFPERRAFNTLVHNSLYSEYCDQKNKTMKSILRYVERCNNGDARSRILTYNFDQVLEKWIVDRGIGISFQSTDFETRLEEGRRVEIFHCHGSLPFDITSIGDQRLIFDESEYHSLNYDHYNRSNILQFSTFLDQVCIFVGLSLSDPGMRRLLDHAAGQQRGDPKHFAFRRLPAVDASEKKKDAEIKIKHLKSVFEIDALSLGIQLIWVENYDEIGEVINEMMN